MRQLDDGHRLVEASGQRHVQPVAVHAAGVERQVELDDRGLRDRIGFAGEGERAEKLLDPVRDAGADLARRRGAHAHDPSPVSAFPRLRRLGVGRDADRRDAFAYRRRHQRLDAAPVGIGLHYRADAGLVADDLLELAHVVRVGAGVNVEPGVAGLARRGGEERTGGEQNRGGETQARQGCSGVHDSAASALALSAKRNTSTAFSPCPSA